MMFCVLLTENHWTLETAGCNHQSSVQFWAQSLLHSNSFIRDVYPQHNKLLNIFSAHNFVFYTSKTDIKLFPDSANMFACFFKFILPVFVLLANMFPIFFLNVYIHMDKVKNNSYTLWKKTMTIICNKFTFISSFQKTSRFYLNITMHSVFYRLWQDYFRWKK